MRADSDTLLTDSSLVVSPSASPPVSSSEEMDSKTPIRSNPWFDDGNVILVGHKPRSRFTEES